VPPACGEPVTLLAEVCAQADRLRDLTLLGGIHLGEFPYARPERSALSAATWHMSPRLEDARRRGRVEFVPVRYFDVVTECARGGHWAPDCVLVRTAPPCRSAWAASRRPCWRRSTVIATSRCTRCSSTPPWGSSSAAW